MICQQGILLPVIANIRKYRYMQGAHVEVARNPKCFFCMNENENIYWNASTWGFAWWAAGFGHILLGQTPPYEPRPWVGLLGWHWSLKVTQKLSAIPTIWTSLQLYLILIWTGLLEPNTVQGNQTAGVSTKEQALWRQKEAFGAAFLFWSNTLSLSFIQ